MSSRNQTSSPRVKAVRQEEILRLRQRVADLEGTVNETLLEFYQTMQHLQNLVYKVQERPDGSFVLTLFEGKIAKELQIHSDKIVGKTIDKFLPPDIAQQFISSLRRATLSEQVEFEFEYADRVLFNTVSPVVVNGAVIEFVGTTVDITNLRRAENSLHQIAQGITTATGEAFFLSLVEHLSKVLGVESVLIGKIDKMGKAVSTIAGYAKGQALDNFTYPVEGTPCDTVIGTKYAVYTEGVQHCFPTNQLFKQLQIDSYIGTPLIDSAGKVMGLLVIMHNKPIEEMQLVDSMLKIFAVRASAELERKLAEEELLRSNAILKATKETSIDGILIINEESKMIEYNNRFREIWEIPRKVVEAGDLRKVIDYLLKQILDAETFRDRLHDLDKHPLTSGKGELTLRDGRVLDWYSQAVLSAQGESYGRIWYFRDITYRKKYEEQIRHHVYFDVLTGLPNRDVFQDRLNLGIAQKQRVDEMLAVLSINLDRFKLINATFGHVVGDIVLQGIAKRLAAILEEGDTLCRVGGDEFKMILHDIKQVQDAAKMAQTILHHLSTPLQVEGNELFVTASIGISIYPNDGTDSTTLDKNANTAMYRAKESGMNQYQLYTPAMNVTAFQKLSLENDLRKALDRGELYVVYQPRVNMRTNKLVGMEALVRWEHPHLGNISPGQFIPIAEETELISQIDKFVLRTACAQNKAWQDAGYQPVRVAVNLSAKQFQQKDLADTIAQILKETGLETKWLELEITESVAMNNADTALKMIHELKSLGIHMAIDDFGTGYSSLSYLKKFPIETLKIDQSFVRDITIDPDDAAIVSYIISLGHSLNLNVLAEGVETEEQKAFLSAGMCDEMQGYLFSKPLVPQQFEKILKKTRRKVKT